MSASSRAAAWGAAPFSAGDRSRAQAALVGGVRELRKLHRSSPERANEELVDWVAAIPRVLGGVDDPQELLRHQVARALAELVAWLSEGRSDARTRAAWTDRLWPALMADESGHLNAVADAWGAIAGPENAAAWAERLHPAVHEAWSAGADARESRACLSVLLSAQRPRDVLDLLALRAIGIWPERRFGVLALAALGEIDAAIVYARESNLLGHPYERAIAEVCEQVLLAAGRREQAYADFAHLANRRQNYLQTFRSLAGKYSEREPSAILTDLIAASPGQEGRWFATARSLRFFNLAAEIAQRAPCDPRTLNRAAGERLMHDPIFAFDVAVAALRWIAEGHGHLIDGADVLEAYDIAALAARRLDRRAVLREQIAVICGGKGASAEWTRRLLAPQLEEDT